MSKADENVESGRTQERAENTPRRRGRYKAGQITFAPGQPIEITDQPHKPTLSAQEKKVLKHIGEVIKEYLKAGHELLATTYSGAKEFAPTHLAYPCKAFVFCCNDGVVIRYERSLDDKDQIRSGWLDDTADAILKGASEAAVYCVPPGSEPSSIDVSSSPKLQLVSENAITGEQTVLVDTKIAYLLRLESQAPDLSTAAGKPFRLAGLESHFEFHLRAIEVNESRPSDEGREFITRTVIRLPVGWDYIELYPSVDLKYWRVDSARLWAENDILAWVMRRQAREQHFRALDPNVDARREWAQLLDEYRTVLDSGAHEEVLHQFLLRNPALLCPTQKRVWSKVPFGGSTSDFVFQEAAGHYLLVEIESPRRRLFVKSGDTSKDLNHAQNQVMDWKRYIADNPNTVQAELGLIGISPNPRSLIVIGRSANISSDGRRKLATMGSDSPGQKIMTYDDVLENAKAAIENVLGPMWASSAAAEVYFLSERSEQPT